MTSYCRDNGHIYWSNRSIPVIVSLNRERKQSLGFYGIQYICFYALRIPTVSFIQQTAANARFITKQD